MVKVGFYLRVPTVVEACRVDDLIDSPREAWPEWARSVVTVSGRNDILVDCADGPLHADRSCWLLRGADGEVYPCLEDIFAQKYVRCRQ